MAKAQIELWERDHPEYRKLNQDDPNREVLEWAHKKRYITLKSLEGRTYYSDFDLEVAKMWQEKEGVLDASNS